jgi:hypothetical protein
MIFGLGDTEKKYRKKDEILKKFLLSNGSGSHINAKQSITI